MNMMSRLEPRQAPPSNDHARRAVRFRKLISLFERDEIEAGVDALIAYLDAKGGDPDLDQDGDEQDVAMPFRPHSDDRPAKYRDAAAALADGGDGGLGEDDEDDDPAGGNIEDERHDPEEDCCLAGDDEVIAGPVINRGQWLADTFAERRWGIGSEDDAEPRHPEIHLTGNYNDDWRTA